MEANRGRPKTDQPTEQSTKNGRWRTTANGYLAEGVGFEPTRERKPPGGFQDRCLKPLGHPSNLNNFSGLAFQIFEPKYRLLPFCYRPSFSWRCSNAPDMSASTWIAASACMPGKT